MKSFVKKILLVIGSVGMLVGCASNPSPTLEVLDDPVIYDDDEGVVELEDILANKKYEEEPPVGDFPNQVIIHYHNDDGENLKYPRQFYLWNTNQDGFAFDADSDATGTDMKITIDFTTEKYAYLGNWENICFIIKRSGTWDGQSDDVVIYFTEDAPEGSNIFLPDEEGHVEIWSIPGEGTQIEVYKTEEETKLDKIKSAYFTDWKTIHCEATVAPKSWKLYAFEETYLRSGTITQERDKEKFLLKSGGKPTCKKVHHYAVDEYTGEVIVDYEAYEFDIKLNYTAHINVKYVIETTYDAHTKTMICQPTNDKLYTTNRFEQFYNYNGQLGAIYSKEQTTFRLWAPTSSIVYLKLYETGTPKSFGGSNVGSTTKMCYRKGGVWELTVKGNLDGKYYTYIVTNSAGTNEVIDPYAYGCGVNGLRGMVYDPDTTKPEGWDNLPVKWDKEKDLDIKTPQDLSIYEVHVRDLTSDSTWRGNSPRGTYKAFAEKGTTYSRNGKTVKTGFDHIEELGVRALQLMPVFDADNNEIAEEGELPAYNWGYNPLNYNCVDGIYSTNPYDGKTRIQEYKDLIYKYATNSMHQRIIMDVVFNHVSSAPNSIFSKIMPRYYFRYDKYYRYENGSGCANEVRTDATMMRKFIVDSLVHWASEYKVKGFRFDLMGLIDMQTMKAVKEALYEIDPDIYVYGEGWTSIAGYHGPSSSSNMSSDTWAVYNKLYESSSSKGYVGCFNDAGRDAIRGGNDGGWGSDSRFPGYGFISQGSGDIGDKSRVVGEMLRGVHEGKGGNPIQCVNYASCHDNYTLFDQLNYTLSNDGGKTEPSFETVADAVTAVEGAIMASNGVALMLGGEELFRTKVEYEPEKSRENEDFVRMYGRCISHNSYKSSDRTNAFKWDRKIIVGSTNTAKYFDAFKKMIKMRKEMPTFQYPLPNNADGSKMNYWGAGDGSTVVGFHREAYNFAICGRSTTNIGVGTMKSFIYANRGQNDGYSISGNTLKFTKPYTCVAFKV